MNVSWGKWEEKEPGQKLQFMATITGTDLQVPVTTVTGVTDGPKIIITTGVHGSEYPATKAVVELARELDPASMRGQLIMIHPINLQALRQRVAFIMPQDGINLNRAFPGDPQGSTTFRVAWWLTQLTDKADFYLDLHSGDLFEELTPFVYYPGNADDAVIKASQEVAKVLDMPYMVPSTSTTGAYNSATLRGTPALLVERGGAGFCRQAEVAAYKRDLINALKQLNVLDGPPEANAQQPVDVKKVIYISISHEAYWQIEVTPGQKVKAGDLLGRTCDLFGNPMDEYHAEIDGVVLYQLYTLSATAGDVLVAYGS